MKMFGIRLQEGSAISNLTVSAGTTFPADANEGELFYRSDSDIRVKGLYLYVNESWDRIASTETLSCPTGTTLPELANEGDLFYLNTGESNEGLHVYKNTAWVNISVAAASSGTVTSVAVSGADGIEVSGSPVSTSGTINLSLGNIAPSSITVPGGTAAAPTYSFSLDSDTGIFSPAANEVAISTDGVTRLTVGTGIVAAQSAIIRTETGFPGWNAEIYDPSNHPIYAMSSAAGTIASPTAIANGRVLGAFLGRGHTGSGFAEGARVQFSATENWTSSAIGSQVVISAVPNGETTRSTILTLNSTAITAGSGVPFVGNLTGVASGNLALSGGTVSGATIFRAAGAVRSEAAATQDAVVLAGRAGGTGSFAVSLTPATLTDSRTLTLPNASGTIALITDLPTVNNGTLTLGVSGVGLTGSASFTANQAGGSTFTVTSNATSANTVSTVVSRDASGNFSAGTITAALSGNATTATALATGRTFSVSGDATGTSATFDGSANATIPLTLATVNTNVGQFAVTTVNGKGLVTAATTLSLSGDVTGTSSGATLATTLATVNSNVGTFGSATQVGTFTVNGKGLITAANNTSIAIAASQVTGGTFADSLLSSNVALLNTAQVYTTANTFRAANSVRAEAAASQDAVVLAGRAGGTGSFGVTLTPTTLTANRTLTLPDSAGTVALTSQLPTVNNGTLTLAVSGVGLSGSASFTANQSGGSTFTVTSNATSSNTVSTVVSRDASGNFSAGTITGSLTGAASLNVLKSGDTMTGALTLPGDPTSNLHAATKSYVDNLAQGVIARPAVRAATTGNLTATYNNGTAGVGATLTGTGALPTIDGVTLGVGNGVLVRAQTTAAQNGRYVVTTLSPNWVLTRCGLCDQASEIPGSYVFVNEGTLYAATGWVQTVSNAGTFTVGTDAITVTQFSAAGAYAGGTGISVSGTTISLGTGNALSLHNLSTNGLVARTAANTVTARTLTGPAAGITVSNGDGVSGNPTLALADDLAAVEGLSTTGIIRRTGANTWTAGGAISLTTEVTGTLPIANGGTGATTADAALTSLGGTTVGSNLFKLTNPSAITFLRVNANNTVSALNAADFRTATGAGTVTSVSVTTANGVSGTVANATTTPAITLTLGAITPSSITTSGNVVLGHTAAVATRFDTNTLTPSLQDLGADVQASSSLNARYSADTGSAWLFLAKSRNATVGSHTAVLTNDQLGAVSFAGSDGTAFTEAARIRAVATANAAANNISSRLEFMTTNAGTNPQIALSISPTNEILIGGTVAYATRVNTTSITPAFQNPGTTANGSSSLEARYSGDSGGPYLFLAKSRNNTVGLHTAVLANDELGSVSFAGSDGTAFTEGARIRALATANAATNSISSRLEFMTTNAGTNPSVGMTVQPNNQVTMPGNIAASSTTTGTLVVTGGAGVSGNLYAANFFGNGANITALNATQLTSGTVPDARISGSYTGMTNLTGSGDVDFARFLGNAGDSAAAPSFSWTGDLDTGMYTPGADQIGFSTGGAARVLINSAGATVTGQVIADQGFRTSTSGNVHRFYETNVEWGSDTAGTWRRLANVVIASGQFASHGFVVEVDDSQTNHATPGSVNSIRRLTYYVACVRTESTTLDTPNACYVTGPLVGAAAHIRAVRIATGEYEVQIQNLAQFREARVRLHSYAHNGTVTVTFFDGSTAGAAGQAQYTPTASTTAGEWFQNIYLEDGTAANPSIRFGSALSTGLFAPASNTLGISANGTERLRIINTGAWGLSGANYGTSGQVLTSNGSGSAPTWTTISSGTTTNALTINNSGTGAASGTTFNGSAAVTISHNTIGAAALASANTFTAANTFRAANSVRAEAAATQDAVVLAGRAGGTGSFAVTLTPATLTANRTLTLPNLAGTLLTDGWAGSSNITTVGTIGTGTWQGGIINSTYGGTGINNGGRTLTISGQSFTLSGSLGARSITTASNIVVSGATTNGRTLTFATGDADRTVTLANNFTTAGNFPLTLTTTASTNVTLPTSGTLATTAQLPTVNNATLTLNVSGSGLSGSQTWTANQGTAATFTVTSNATTANNANTIVLRDGSGNVALSTGSTANGVIIGYRTIPVDNKTASYTLTAADTGRAVDTNSGVTVPTGLAAGTTVTIYNNTTGTITITQGASVTLRLAGGASTGNRTLAQRGIATVWYRTTTEAIISGAGLT